MLRSKALVSVFFLLAAGACVVAQDDADQRERGDGNRGAGTGAKGLRSGSAATGSDWPRFLGPTGDGKSPETDVLLDWGAGGPPVLFRKTVGEGYAMPVVAGGKLFQFDRHGDRERLSCLDSTTGAELWRAEAPTAYVDTYGFGTGPRSSPLVDEDRVYTFGVEGRLNCHRAADGKLLWSVDTSKRFRASKNFFGVGSSPVVEGPLLIVPVGGSSPAYPDGSAIVAFDKLTGEVRYAVGKDQASYASPALATIGARRWGFVFARGGLIGFEPERGVVDFQYPWRATRYETVNASTPVVVGDTVLVSEGYGPGSSVLRVRAGEFEVLWKDPPGRDKSLLSHWATPIHHEGTLYGCSGEKGGNAELRAIDWATGQVLWKQPGLGRVTLLYVAGHIVVLTERGRLIVVRATPEGYREVAGAGAEAVVASPAWNAPILSRGILYVGGKDQLVAFDLRPGAEKP